MINLKVLEHVIENILMTVAPKLRALAYNPPDRRRDEGASTKPCCHIKECRRRDKAVFGDFRNTRRASFHS